MILTYCIHYTFSGLMLDTLARTALWQVGLNYRHGTGHGVGAYLHVHEGMRNITINMSKCDEIYTCILTVIIDRYDHSA